MSFWYDAYCTDYLELPQKTVVTDRLYNDDITDQKAVFAMPKFDKERMLKTMMDGSEEQKRALVEELANMLNHKSYGLVWEHGGTTEDSPFEAEDVVLEYNKGIPYPVLREDLSLSNKREREREREPLNGHGNFLLEGDNYIWLKMLEQTHASKIDVIYIDPPYNTGNKDFKYNDKFVDPEDTFRHSKWLDFICKRLNIAQKLLTSQGVMFISCDEHEQPSLMLLCQDLFGTNNVDCIIWDKNRDNGSGKLKRTKHFLDVHEYIIVCYKDKGVQFSPVNIPGDGSFQTTNLAKNNAQKNGDKSRIFTITNKDNGMSWTDEWKRDKEYIDNLIAEDLLYFGKDGTSKPRQILPQDERRTVYLESIIPFGSTTIGNKEIEELGFEFQNPKPVKLIKYLLQTSTNKNSVILDFFAGSGTTAQAVEELNKHDNGNRKWILITNNEDQDADGSNPDTGICRDITKPRIDTVITGVRPDGSRYSDGYDSGYTYYQYKFIDRVKHQYQRNAYSFFRPYIVDAFIPLAYGAHKTAQNEEKMLCIYENNNQRIITFFGDVDANGVQAVIDEYQTDGKTPIILLPEDATEFKSIQIEQLRNGIEVKYHHSLISQAGYLQ